jgi:hypothetical protein
MVHNTANKAVYMPLVYDQELLYHTTNSRDYRCGDETRYTAMIRRNTAKQASTITLI